MNIKLFSTVFKSKAVLYLSIAWLGDFWLLNSTITFLKLWKLLELTITASNHVSYLVFAGWGGKEYQVILLYTLEHGTELLEMLF